MNEQLNLNRYQIEMLQRALRLLPIDAGEVNDYLDLQKQLGIHSKLVTRE